MRGRVVIRTPGVFEERSDARENNFAKPERVLVFFSCDGMIAGGAGVVSESSSSASGSISIDVVMTSGLSSTSTAYSGNVFLVSVVLYDARESVLGSDLI